jgi:hypothetical protein
MVSCDPSSARGLLKHAPRQSRNNGGPYLTQALSL